MKIPHFSFLCALLLTAAGCGSRAAAPASASASADGASTPELLRPVHYTYVVRATYPHDRKAYTQGLLYDRGRLWEGTGLEGASRLRIVDLPSGRPLREIRLDKKDFGEGIALHGGRLFQLTWRSGRAYVYDTATLHRVETFTYPGEGWGLASDGERLYMSDGTDAVRILDPAGFRATGTLRVTYEGRPLRLLNELEWVDGRLWANVYTTDAVVIIDPQSGAVEGVVDFTGLLAPQKRDERTDVLNGIAYDPLTQRLFVTGKNWPELYEVQIVRTR